MDKEFKIKLAGTTAIVAAFFVVMVSILLLLNYFQLRTSDPLESKTLKVLVDQLANQPDNEQLKEEIRNIDLLARKAFFTSQWQIKTGGWLILAGGVLIIVSLKIFNTLTEKIEKPGEKEPDNLTRVLSQRWILIFAFLILFSGLAASFLSKDYLKKEIQEISLVAETSYDTTGIEIIDIKTDSILSSIDSSLIDTNLVTGEEAVPGQITDNTSFPGAAELKRNHYAFRGPFGNGISYNKNIPVDWDGASGKNIKWKIPVPKGHNSPVVWGDKLFFAGADASSKVIYCYDRLTGKLIWQKPADNIPGSPATPPKTTDDTGLSAPTLTTDGKNVYAIFGTGDIIAFDINGNRLWARNLGVPGNHYGHSSSLISWKNKLFVQFDTNKGGKLLSLNVFTGETIWEKSRGSKISWASPILAEINNNYQVVLCADPIVAGYNTETGEEIWNVKCLSGEVGPSPAFGEGMIYAANEYATLAAIDPISKSIVWETNEYLPEVASPVVSNGLLFIGTSYGVLACYDAKTGEKYWEFESNKGFYSSPVIADNKLFAVDMDGVTHIFEVSKELKKIGEPSLGEKIVTTPAFADGTIYLKGEKNLYCIGK